MTGPIQTLIDLAKRQCEAAARALAEKLAAERSVHARSRMLEDYRGDYERRISDAGRAGTTGRALGGLHAFVGRVGEAIGEQQREVERAAARVAAARSALALAERRLAAFETLAARRAREAAVRERRREQRQEDEFAARRSRERAAGTEHRGRATRPPARIYPSHSKEQSA